MNEYDDVFEAEREEGERRLRDPEFIAWMGSEL